MRRAKRVQAATLACLLAGVAWAQGLPPALRDSVQALPPAQRAQVLERQARLDRLSPPARAGLQQRFAAWEARSSEEQRALREAWSAWRALPPIEQALLRNSAATFATLEVPAPAAHSMLTPVAARATRPARGVLCQNLCFRHVQSSTNLVSALVLGVGYFSRSTLQCPYL